ncbi:MAG: hypothetical protein GC192_07410 [Bacteroidetes bacterium]|nr:hypothetical protein [Bacteroidota bacterium]
MIRYQVFDVPHKALRLALSNLLNLAAKTDFAVAQDISSLKNLMAEVFSLIKSHSHHEDDIAFPELDKLLPNATQHDREEHIKLHARLDALLVEVETVFKTVENGKDAAGIGRDLYTNLCVLHADMLNHMMEEERDTQPIIWLYMSDEELMSMEPRIMAALTPDMSMLWMKYILPTKTEKELVEMLKGMQQMAPPPVFEATMNLAETVLPASSWENLQMVFELADIA